MFYQIFQYLKGTPCRLIVKGINESKQTRAVQYESYSTLILGNHILKKDFGLASSIHPQRSLVAYF